MFFDENTNKGSSMHFSPEKSKKAKPSLQSSKNSILQKFLTPQSITSLPKSSYKESDLTELPRLCSYSFTNNNSILKIPSFSLDKKQINSVNFNEQLTRKSFKKKNKRKSTFSLDEKTEHFLDYLDFLKTQNGERNKKITKEMQIPPRKSQRLLPEIELPELAPESALLKLFDSQRRKKKKSVVIFLESPELPRPTPTFTNMTINTISYNKINGSMSTLNSSTKLRKRGSISLSSNSRAIRIKNYHLLNEIVGKLAKNLATFLNIVSNERKGHKLIHDILKFNKLKYLEKLFFIDRKEQFVENLSASAMENACFFKECQFNVMNKSQIYEEKLISPTIVQDLTLLNDKIEGYLVERHINEMRNLTVDLTFKLKGLEKIEVENFNYETMPDHSLIDDILEMRNQFGNLENFDKKELIIGKTIDEMIRNVKYDHEATENYFNVIELKKK